MKEQEQYILPLTKSEVKSVANSRWVTGHKWHLILVGSAAIVCIIALSYVAGMEGLWNNYLAAGLALVVLAVVLVYIYRHISRAGQLLLKQSKVVTDVIAAEILK